MLNLSCVICSELLTATEEVYVTQCGHLFHKTCISDWLQRSQTCPHCRHCCSSSNVHRIYFNLETNETATANIFDSGTVNELLDSANLQVKESERSLKKADEEIRLLTQAQHEYIEKVFDLEQKIEDNIGSIQSYKEEVVQLKRQIVVLEVSNTNLENAVAVQSAKKHELAEEVIELKAVIEAKEKSSSSLEKEVSNLQSNLSKLGEMKTILTNHIKKLKEDLTKETEKRKSLEENEGKNLASLTEHNKCAEELAALKRTFEEQEKQNLASLNEHKKCAEELAALKRELEASGTVKNDLSSVLENVQCYLRKDMEFKKIGEELLAQLENKLKNESNDGDSKHDQSPNPKALNSQRHLMWLAKEKARAAGWKYVWIKDGKVLARKENNARVIHIENADDVRKIE